MMSPRGSGGASLGKSQTIRHNRRSPERPRQVDRIGRFGGRGPGRYWLLRLGIGSAPLGQAGGERDE